MDYNGKIEEIVNVPIFIQKYIEVGVEHFNGVILNDFCNIIKNTEYSTKTVNGHYEYLFDVGVNNYTVKRFIEFYFNKSSLKSDYSCPYEEELDLPQSVSNEIFVIKFEENIFALAVDRYIDNILYFRLV
jgi:hypothetical protein